MTSHLIARLAKHLLNGQVFQLEIPATDETPKGVITAGNGSLLDWRTVRSGDVVVENGCAFDVAYMLVMLTSAALLTDALDRLENP